MSSTTVTPAAGTERWQDTCPYTKTAEQAYRLACAGAVATTTQITVRTVAGEGFERIIDYQLGPKPEIAEPGEDQEEPAFQPTVTGSVEDDEVPF